MEHLTTYNIKEIAALVFSVLIGSGAYVGFVALKRQQNLSVKYVVLVILINLFVTYVGSEILKIFNWGMYRAPALPMVAFGGQYLTDWFDKRYLKIFDSASKKAGLNLKESEDEKEDNNQ